MYIVRCIVIVALCAWIFSNIAQAAELPEPPSDNDYYFDGTPPSDLFSLGRDLFFDKELSGNRNISCATCHNPLLSGSDGVSLGSGEGGEGIGKFRSSGVGAHVIENRVPRHAPSLFNLGAKEFVRLNWNGHMEANPTTLEIIRLPSAEASPPGLINVLAGQALFPLANIHEMVGQEGENEIADLVDASLGILSFQPIWDALIHRLVAIPDYVSAFIVTFDDVDAAEDITIAHVGNALSAFQGFAFRSDRSQFDHYLRGDSDALTAKQIRGMNIFYGVGGCDSCHSGKFQTDHDFHAIAMPQVGPGPDAGTPGQDNGRQGASGDPADYAKFRTPSLRNVWVTAPYGHGGAYNTLKEVVEHHLDPVVSINDYNTRQAVLSAAPEAIEQLDFQGHEDLALRQLIIDANELQPLTLSDDELSDLLEFLRGLTDWNELNMDWTIPETVPSGLPVND